MITKYLNDRSGNNEVDAEEGDDDNDDDSDFQGDDSDSANDNADDDASNKNISPPGPPEAEKKDGSDMQDPQDQLGISVFLEF
jgi:hypothetical protein